MTRSDVSQISGELHECAEMVAVKSVLEPGLSPDGRETLAHAARCIGNLAAELGGALGAFGDALTPRLPGDLAVATPSAARSAWNPDDRG